MSRDAVTIDEIWAGNRIYWTPQHTTRDYTLQIAITQRLVFSVTVFTALLGNVFQQCTFLCFRVHALAGWRPSHTNCRLKTLYIDMDLIENTSRNSYSIITSRSYRHGLLPTVTPMLRITQLLPSNGRFSGSTILAFSRHATIRYLIVWT
jgi:hypothetical protein